MVYFFMSVMFATKEELGWDPTIVRNPRTKRYDIAVRNANGQSYIFRTTGVVNIVKADALRGTAARIWLCVRLTNSGKPAKGKTYVLKDAWIDITRPREGDRYEQIENDAAAASDPDRVKGMLSRVFIKRHSHGDVLLHGEPDRTKDVPAEHGMYLLWDPSENDSAEQGRAFASRMATGNHCVGTANSSSLQEAPPLEYHTKVHYRIVLCEEGTPLHKLDSLEQIFGAICAVIPGWCRLSLVRATF